VAFSPRVVREAPTRPGSRPGRQPVSTPTPDPSQTDRLDTVNEAALLESLRLYRAMFDRSAVGQVVIVLGRDIDRLSVGEITPANEGTERLAQGNTDDYTMCSA
jgi:hypothetical protein